MKKNLASSGKASSRLGFRKISRRILVFFMIAIVSCLGFSGWFITRIAKDIVTSNISEADMERIRRIAGIADSRMSSVQAAIDLSAQLFAESLDKPEAIKKGARALREGFPEIASLYVADASGRQLFRSDGLGKEGVEGVLAFQMASRGERVVSDVYPDVMSARPVRTFTLPIRNENGIVAVLEADVAFGPLVEIMEKIPLSGDIQIFIVSSSGTAVAHTSLAKLESLDLSRLPTVDPVLAGLEGSISGYKDELGRYVVGTYTPISSLGWGVISQRSISDIAAIVSRFQGIVIAATVIAVLLSLIIGQFISRRIARPIVNLVEASKKVANGDFSHNVDVDYPDEIGTLAISFNVMVDALKKFSDDLIQANSTLENKVAQRTSELAQQSGELAIALEQAKSADKLKSAFLATMSHELRTPLNSIIGFTGILQQQLAGPLNPEQQKQMGMIRASSRHLLSLINDVLDISKIEAGQLEIAFQPFDMRSSIETTLAAIVPLAEKNHLEIEAEIASNVGVIISDKRRVEQILMNLLSNAVKFTLKGSVKIVCAVEGNNLITKVIDSGCGIRTDDIEKLFVPFRQIDSGLSRQHEGTGLGLSISKRLVSLLSGSIWVESEWGKGSVFGFSLPLDREKR